MAGAQPPRTLRRAAGEGADVRTEARARQGSASPRRGTRVALEAANDAWELGLVDPVLVGDRAPIEKAAGRARGSTSPGGRSSRSRTAASRAARKAVELVREGDVDFLMKGKVQTADIMRAALDKETGIRAGKLMSHIWLSCGRPTFGRLLGMSDGGIVLEPGRSRRRPTSSERGRRDAQARVGVPERRRRRSAGARQSGACRTRSTPRSSRR